jgi:hypothetical protein
MVACLLLAMLVVAVPIAVAGAALAVRGMAKPAGKTRPPAARDR